MSKQSQYLANVSAQITLTDTDAFAYAFDLPGLGQGVSQAVNFDDITLAASMKQVPGGDIAACVHLRMIDAELDHTDLATTPLWSCCAGIVGSIDLNVFRYRSNRRGVWVDIPPAGARMALIGSTTPSYTFYLNLAINARYRVSSRQR